MCGVIGIGSTVPVTDRSWLERGRDQMAHRGPDDVGLWWSEDGRVGLGHRRLSIVDLSAAGHQPMHDRERGLSIVFNGEIYNFRELRLEIEQRGHHFHSTSDTEVLLAAYDTWGTDCLSHLNGMFAFAIHDTDRQLVFLARDRAGEKPLYYFLTPGSLRFSSELKGLLADPSLPRRVDPEALDNYLLLGRTPGDRCILAGYNKLPPAHALTFDLRAGAVQRWRYWELPMWPGGDAFSAGHAEADASALADELEGLLEDAVRHQLVADVPVGILLSGGVDSSLVTAMAVRSSDNIRTFTVGFPGSGALDEREHARLIADHFKTNHTELVADPINADALPDLAHQFDEPLD